MERDHHNKFKDGTILLNLEYVSSWTQVENQLGKKLIDSYSNFKMEDILAYLMNQMKVLILDSCETLLAC